MGRCRLYWHPALLLTILAISICGCGGSSAPDPGGDDDTLSADGGLAAFDDLAGAADRLASDAQVFPGDVLAKSAGVTSVDGVLRIQAPIGGTAWAIWGWRKLDYGANYPIGVDLDLAYPSGKCYIGVPDFSRQCWRFCGPFSGLAQQIDTTAVSPLRASPSGVSYVAVVCYNGASVRLESLTLKTGYVTHVGASPLAWCESRYYSGSSYDYIYLSWEQKPASYGYEVKRWEPAQGEAGAVVFTEYQGIPGSDESGRIRYRHFRDAQVVPGRYYQYRVTGVQQDGTRSRPGPVTLGYSGPSDDALPLRGRVMYDEYYTAPGIELYVPEAELHVSTDEDGNYCIPGLDPGAYNLWVVSPMGPQHGKLVLLESRQTVVPDIVVDLTTVPDYNWHWLYPPQQVDAVRTGPRRVELSWSEAQYAGSYRVYRSYELEPEDLTELYSGVQTSLTLENEPAGVLHYRVQAVEGGVPDDRRYSPLSLPAIVTVPFQGIAPDSIYAIPDKILAHDGERVLVTVYTSQAASPLQFMNGCRITYEAENTFVRESFNVGAPGGAKFEPDGVWQQVDPTQGILGVPLNLIVERDIGHGRRGCDLNVTPVGGADVNLATGALFNFEIEVHADVNFSFVAREGNLRTYYSGGDSDARTWNDCYNYGQPTITLIDN